MLSPLLNSGYISDDAVNSLLKGKLLVSRQDLSTYFFQSIKHWMFYNARFYPFAFLSSAFLFINNLLLYKASILAMVLINITLFAYLIRLLTNSDSLSLLSVSLLPLCFQFRLYHDPILSFGWLQELLLIYTVTSLIFLVHYLKTGSKPFFILSVIVYMVSLMTYEIIYVYFLFHLLIIYFYSDKKDIGRVLKVGFPFILSVMVMGGISFFLRWYYPQGYEGTRTSFNAASYVMTLLRQSFAAVPLSYFTVDPHKIFIDKVLLLKGIFSRVSLLLIACYGALFLNIFYRMKHEELFPRRNRIGLIFIFGTLLVFLPGALISLSSKYQKEVIWGVGYIPVYSSYFGLSVVASTSGYWLIEKLVKKHQKLAIILCAIFAMICGAVGTLNFNNNVTTVAKINYSFLYPRTLIEEGMQNGLFRSVHNGAFLIAESDYDLDAVQDGWNLYRWDRPAFYRMHSGITFKDVLSKGKFLKNEFLSKFAVVQHDANTSIEFSDTDNVYFLYYSSQSNSDGSAVLGRIRSFYGNNDSIHRAISGDTTYIYIRSPFCASKEDVSVQGCFIEKKQSEERCKHFVSSSDSLRLINSGMNWKLYSLESTQWIDLKSLRVTLAKINSE